MLAEAALNIGAPYRFKFTNKKMSMDRSFAGWNHAATGSEPGGVLSFAEIISALSFAVDLTEGAVPGHAVRTCILGMRMGRELKLSLTELVSLYYALLLKDTGCSNNAARMCQIVGGDDRTVKNGAKLQDWTKPLKPSWSTMKLLWREVLPGASPWKKTLRILQIGLTQHQNNAEMIKLRCERGAQIARKLGLSTETAGAIRALDEHWNGMGYPDRLKGKEIPLLAQILAVAQHLDIFACERGPEVAMQVLCQRSGVWFDPALVRVAVELERDGRLWTSCLPTDDIEAAREIVLGLEPFPGSGIRVGVQCDEIDMICEAFADVVDAKSPFTYRHSVGVAEVAREIASTLGLPRARRELVWRAALLHDLGKLAVPNTILDKPGKLTEEEFNIVKQHPRLSREILARIKPFQEMAEIAGAHHERLNGTGYPDNLREQDLSLESKLVAVADFYRALVEDRPYRAGMSHQEAMAILETASLDSRCVSALDRAWRKSAAGQRAAEAERARESDSLRSLVSSRASA
jgi:putative nucleotidyltransferase with HDIG domain